MIFCVSSIHGTGAPPPFPFADKLIHIVEYGILGFLVARALAQTKPSLSVKALIGLAVFLCVLYGISDEFHQSFVPLRDADVFDVVADAIGSFFGSVVYWKSRELGAH